jgi:hypothetical protein
MVAQHHSSGAANIFTAYLLRHLCIVIIKGRRFHPRFIDDIIYTGTALKVAYGRTGSVYSGNWPDETASYNNNNNKILQEKAVEATKQKKTKKGKT